LLLVVGLANVPKIVHGKPPNIVLFISDDLGMGEVNQQPEMHLGFPTNPLGKDGGSQPKRPAQPLRTYLTPNLERLARQSARALLSYSGSSTCTPSRASILVSRSSGTVHMRDNLRVQNLNLDLLDMAFPTVLRNLGGYHTALVGTPLPFFSFS